MERLSNWARTLPDRHGRTTLVLLGLILALGFGVRAYRVVEPLATPGDDAHAYYALSKALYEEGTYGGPDPHDPRRDHRDQHASRRDAASGTGDDAARRGARGSRIRERGASKRPYLALRAASEAGTVVT